MDNSSFSIPREGCWESPRDQGQTGQDVPEAGELGLWEPEAVGNPVIPAEQHLHRRSTRGANWKPTEAFYSPDPPTGLPARDPLKALCQAPRADWRRGELGFFQAIIKERKSSAEGTRRSDKGGGPKHASPNN